MAHHSSEMSESMRKCFEEMAPAVGATGRFPHGRLSAGDDGELALAIGVMDGKIVVNFGKPVMWIGFTREQAKQLAQMIYDKADSLP